MKSNITLSLEHKIHQSNFNHDQIIQFQLQFEKDI